MKVHLFLVTLALTTAFHSAEAELSPNASEQVASVKQNLRSVEDWDRYGMALARAQRYSEAQDAIKQALSLSQPVDSFLLQHLAIVYAMSGNYDAAVAQIDHGLSIEMNNPELAARRADILSWKGDLKEATKAYEKLVGLLPGNDGYWLKLAQLYTWQDRSHDALSSYKKALHINPGDIEAYIGAARVYQNNHQFSEAEKILHEGLTLFPTDARLTTELAAVTMNKSMSHKEIADIVELFVLAIILFLMARDVWRERRMMRRRQIATRVLIPALVAMTMLMVVVYIDILYSGTYYKMISSSAQLIKPIVLGVLLTLILIWQLRYERPLRQKTVLAIGAHPDDIEFGCGATILRMREEGAATYGLVLTGGERGHSEADTSKVREEEAGSAAQVMALCDIELHNFPDTALHEHKAEIRSVIEKALARWRPDVIFTHNEHDVHTDHHTVFDATREAARGAYTILCYENPNTPPGFKPEYFYDVGNYINGKIEALSCHKTQMGKAYAADSVVRAMAGFRGTQARVPLAEGFEVVRVLEKDRKQ